MYTPCTSRHAKWKTLAKKTTIALAVGLAGMLCAAAEATRTGWPRVRAAEKTADGATASWIRELKQTFSLQAKSHFCQMGGNAYAVAYAVAGAS